MTRLLAIARELSNRFPRLKRLAKRIMESSGLGGRVSSRYVQLNEGEAAKESSRLRSAWQSRDLPARQRNLVDGQLADYRRGKPVDVFDILVCALRALPTDLRSKSLLEVGCSSGFYSEVLEIAGLDIRYTGCDYSEAFVTLARQKYPALNFGIEDATALEHDDNAFDIVVSGCCLLHIPEYQKAVAETARVASSFAIFHRTPVVLGQPNVYYRKQAYGVETVEIHFNEPQFLELLARQGLELIATYTLDESVQGDFGSANRTYVCRKISP